MELTLPLSTLFQLFAAFNAAALGTVAVCRAHLIQVPVLQLAGIGLVLAASTMAIISFEQAGYLAGVPAWALAESLLTLAAGPVLIALILAILRQRIPALVL